jgi:long-chain acyl-CoA synthetase
MLSVPALARSFKKNIESGVKAKGKFTVGLFHLALKVGYKYHGNGTQKSFGQMLLAPLMWIFDKILFNKVRESFGGRLKFFIGGGALLDIELQRFFFTIGVPMYQGYGLSEASPVISSNTPDIHKIGTSGKLVNDLDIRILDDDGQDCPEGSKGEIVVKGENVMKGYWKNPATTAETLKDGWLHTGDLGYLDKDGFLYVLGRFKSLLIGNDGEKYSPEGIEEALIDNSELIEQCMLYNNQNPYTIGLVVINSRALKNALNVSGHDLSSDAAVQEAATLIDRELKNYQSGGEFEGMFPQRWLPAATGIVVEPFSEENGLINSTLKMVRTKVVERHQDLLDYLYTPNGKAFTSERNLAAIRTLVSE